MCRIPISFLFVHYFVFPCRHENCHQHVRWRKICWFFDLMMMMMMMMMMMIMNFFLWYGWPTKGVSPYFQPGPLSEILTSLNLRHAASRVWACAEPEFRLSWMELYSSDNRYTTAPLIYFSYLLTFLLFYTYIEQWICFWWIIL